MPKMKTLYDEELVSSIVRGGKAEVKEEVDPLNDPLNQIAPPKLTKKKGTVLFSSVFWQPSTIPDLPLPMFKVEDWHVDAQNYIPSVDPCWIWNRPATEALALAMYSGDTTLLHGLQGTGKSCLAEQWCAKFNIPFWRMSCNRETREAHFLGSPSVEYNDAGQMFIKQEPTLLTESLSYGGMFCEDEAFRHNSALVLQSLREKNTRYVLLPDAPGRTADERKLKAPVGKWWYVLTDNTVGTGDETGVFDAEVQDASSLDRIGAVIEVAYLDKGVERGILKKHSDLNDTIVDKMLDVAKMVRLAFSKQQLLNTMSVRTLLCWAEKTELTQSIEQGLMISWFGKLNADDREVVKDIFHQVFARELK